MGLRPLYKAAVERIQLMDIPDAHKLAWIWELTLQYRAATQTGSPGASATMVSAQGGK